MKTKTFSLIVLSILLSPIATAQTPAPTLPKDFYFAGASFNSSSGSDSPVAISFGYAHRAITDNTYPFVLYDAVPNSFKPFSVNNNVAVGVAQKLVTVAGRSIYGTTGSGVSWQGPNMGWMWSLGATVPFKVGKSFYILPTLRTQSSSVSNGSRVQVIGGLEFGFGH